MTAPYMQTLSYWRRREHSLQKIVGGALLALGLLMAVGGPLDIAHKLETGETTIYGRYRAPRVLLRADDPAGFHARVYGGGLLIFACGVAFAALGRSLVRTREPIQHGFDAKWELDNAQRRPLDPSA